MDMKTVPSVVAQRPHAAQNRRLDQRRMYYQGG
jgi:hypothetical protein